MTLQEIKDQYAKEQGWDSFHWYETYGYPNGKDVDEIATRYATACCKATQKKCADNAMVGWVGYFSYTVVKESITNPDNIVIL